MSMCLSLDLSLFTAGPDVHRFAICFLPQHLGGQVTWCPCKSWKCTVKYDNMTILIQSCSKVFVMSHMGISLYQPTGLQCLHTKPRLLVSLHLNGQSKVGQFHSGVLALTGQEQILWLRGEWRQHFSCLNTQLYCLKHTHSQEQTHCACWHTLHNKNI